MFRLLPVTSEDKNNLIITSCFQNNYFDCAFCTKKGSSYYRHDFQTYLQQYLSSSLCNEALQPTTRVIIVFYYCYTEFKMHKRKRWSMYFLHCAISQSLCCCHMHRFYTNKGNYNVDAGSCSQLLHLLIWNRELRYRIDGS